MATSYRSPTSALLITANSIASLPRLAFDAPIVPIPKTARAPGYSHPYYWAPFILIGNSQ
jgi:CHAT domain-containing protein